MTTNSRSNDIIITNAAGHTVEFRHTQPLIRANNTPPLACGSQMWLIPVLGVVLAITSPLWIGPVLVGMLIKYGAGWITGQSNK